MPILRKLPNQKSLTSKLWSCSDCEPGRARNSANSMNVDKQATADILALVIEAIIAIVGFALKLIVMTFRSVIKSSKAHFSKSQRSAKRPSSENKVEQVARDHQRLQRQKMSVT